MTDKKQIADLTTDELDEAILDLLEPTKAISPFTIYLTMPGMARPWRTRNSAVGRIRRRLHALEKQEKCQSHATSMRQETNWTSTDPDALEAERNEETARLEEADIARQFAVAFGLVHADYDEPDSSVERDDNQIMCFGHGVRLTNAEFIKLAEGAGFTIDG